MPEGKEKDDLIENVQWHSDEIQELLSKASNRYSTTEQLDEAMDELVTQNQILSQLVLSGLEQIDDNTTAVKDTTDYGDDDLDEYLDYKDKIVLSLDAIEAELIINREGASKAAD